MRGMLDVVMMCLNFLRKGFRAMAGDNDSIGACLGEIVQVLDSAADSIGIVYQQVRDARRWTAFADRATQPAPIGGEEDTSTLGVRQQTHLPTSMSRQLHQQQ